MSESVFYFASYPAKKHARRYFKAVKLGFTTDLERSKNLFSTVATTTSSCSISPSFYPESGRQISKQTVSREPDRQTAGRTNRQTGRRTRTLFGTSLSLFLPPKKAFPKVFSRNCFIFRVFLPIKPRSMRHPTQHFTLSKPQNLFLYLVKVVNRRILKL